MRIHLRHLIVIILYSISTNCHAQQTDLSFSNPGLIHEKVPGKLEQNILLSEELIKNSQGLIKNLPFRNDSPGNKIISNSDKPAPRKQNSFLKFNGGFVSYNYNYRSFIDTPFAATDVSQQYLVGNLNIELANVFPLRINYLMRHSN
ncbi:MAG: hypothetical protein ABIP35_03780, partial [Ginsengibacter sp.]